MSTHAALVEALTRIKANLEQQRRFSVDTLANWKRTCTSAEGDIEELLERAAIAQAAEQPAPVAAADTRKLCTCDGAGRGPGRACVVKAGGRLGELWRCAEAAPTPGAQESAPPPNPKGNP